jgi:hypothetical protein
MAYIGEIPSHNRQGHGDQDSVTACTLFLESAQGLAQHVRTQRNTDDTQSQFNTWIIEGRGHLKDKRTKYPKLGMFYK